MSLLELHQKIKFFKGFNFSEIFAFKSFFDVGTSKEQRLENWLEGWKCWGFLQFSPSEGGDCEFI